MVLAPPKLAIVVLICRLIAVVLEAAALIYCLTAADVSLSTLIFLKMVLSLHLSLSVVRLLYDAAQVFMHAPLPADGWLMATLVASEWIMLHILFAAGASSVAIVEYLYRGLGKCPSLPPHFCAGYRAVAVLTIAAWAVNVPITLMVAYIGAFWDIAIQAAAAALAAEVALAAAENKA